MKRAFVFLTLLRKDKSHTRGFSIVQVLIALMIMTIGMLALLQISGISMKAQKGVEHSAELNNFGTTLTQLLLPKKVCEANIKDLVFDPANTTSLQLTSGPNALKIYYPQAGGTPGSIIKGPLFAETGKELGGWRIGTLGLRVLGPTGSGYLVSIEANFDKKRDSQGALVSFGNSTGMRQTVTLTVTSAADTGDPTKQKITACAGQSACFEKEDIDLAAAFTARGYSTAHGLSKAPGTVTWYYKAKNVNSLGYSVGDRILPHDLQNPGSPPTNNTTFWHNASQVGISWVNVYYPYFMNKSGTSGGPINGTDWTLGVKACE